MNELEELCIEYCHWVLVMENCFGGGNIEQHRYETHEKIGDLLHTHSTKLKDILSNLDKEIGLPLDYPDSKNIQKDAAKYGFLLAEKLEKAFPKRAK